MDSFEDIRIVDLDAERTSWSRVDSTLRTVYLRLNAPSPGVAWVKFFHEERESRVMARRRGFWIENQYIVIDCLPDELEAFHLPDINKSIDYANSRYRRFLVEEADRWRELARIDDDEAQSLQTVRDRLRTALGAAAAPEPPRPEPVVVAPVAAAPETPLVPDDVLSAHDRAVASAAHRAAPAAAPPPAATSPVAGPPVAAAPPAARPGADAPKPVDVDDVEARLAQYRAKVRAAFRNPDA